jgi:hypothetical protein
MARMSGQPRPDFFIVGAPKCGTTAMATYLGRHPQIFMPVAKELHYFGSDLDWRRRPTTDEYLSCFAGADQARRIGEASAGYLYSDNAPAEILDFNRAADIVIMLREPIEMLRSYHAQALYMGFEDIEDFESALAAEADRARGRRIPPGSTAPSWLLYTRMARFAPHVERYLDAFGEDHVHITLFDDLRADTAAAYADVLRFLGCDATFVPRFPVVNARKGARISRLQRLVRDPPAIVRSAGRWLLPRGARVRSRKALYRLNSRPADLSPISDALRKRLRAEFAPDVRRLSGLIDRDLGAWLSQPGETGR